MTIIKHDIKDISLADNGLVRIEWACKEMPVMQLLLERFARERPLDGIASAVACTLPPKLQIWPVFSSREAPTFSSVPAIH